MKKLVAAASELVLASRANLLTAAVNLVALVFFSRYLIDLTGAALWLPGSLRHLAIVLGALVGFGAMKHARITSPISVWRVEHPEPDPSAAGAPGGERASGGEALDQDRDLAPRRLKAQIGSAKRALVLAVAAGVVFAGFISLREQTLVRWDPPGWLIDDLSWDRIQSLETVSEHVRLKRHDGLITADVFVPLWYSAATQAVIDARSRHGDAITSLLDRNFQEFVGWLEGRDRRYVGHTLILTFLIYLLIMLCGAAAWGHGWSTVEELAAFLTDD